MINRGTRRQRGFRGGSDRSNGRSSARKTPQRCAGAREVRAPAPSDDLANVTFLVAIVHSGREHPVRKRMEAVDICSKISRCTPRTARKRHPNRGPESESESILAETSDPLPRAEPSQLKR